MNIEDVQTTAESLVNGISTISSNSISVILDDGSWPLTPNREAALENDGICIIIWEPTSGVPSDSIVSKRRNIYETELPITVESIPAVNFSTDGLNIKPDLLVREILSALSGKPDNDGFEPASEAWTNLGDVAGVSMRVINLAHNYVQ